MHKRATTLAALGAAIAMGAAAAQAPLRLSLALNADTFLLGDRNDAIRVTLAFVNPGVNNVITTRGFSDRNDFHLILRFVDPAGLGIIADEVRTTLHPDPPPPNVLFDGEGRATQVVAVEALRGTASGAPFSLEVIVPNARAYYTLPVAGTYTVQAVTAFRTYDRVRRGESGLFADLDAVDFQGELASNRGRLHLVDDADGDGYAFPVADPRLSQFTEADCDDTRAGVNPGRTEIPGNGLDDDCDPGTSDEPPSVLRCDTDNDAQIDIDDVRAILARRNQSASGPDDPADFNGDGVVDVLDARACVTRCTNPGCAP